MRWTCNSVRHLAEKLNKQGYCISYPKVADLLHAAGYSLQANRKTLEGCNQPDRDAQFHYINQQVKSFQRRGQPVISIDTKKKELIGNYRNGGREWRPRGKPLAVKAHDFKDKKLGKGIPYGVFDMTHNEAWVSVGIDHDTAEFAAATILQWWRKMGAKRFPHATEILITADSGGSNGSRSRLWKVALQSLADRIGLKVMVVHFPPGTSKWNKIEHRLFCHITENWRGQPLVSHDVMVKLIGRTTTSKGLKVKAGLDHRRYPAGKKYPTRNWHKSTFVEPNFTAIGTTPSCRASGKSCNTNCLILLYRVVCCCKLFCGNKLWQSIFSGIVTFFWIVFLKTHHFPRKIKGFQEVSYANRINPTVAW